MHTIYERIHVFQKTCRVHARRTEREKTKNRIGFAPPLTEIIFPYFSRKKKGSKIRYWFRIYFCMYMSSRSAEDRAVNIICSR